MNLEFNHYLTERNIRFLNESNKIESIEEIDYHNPAYQVSGKGHFGAFLLSQESACKKEPLTIKMIRQWQKMITEEQVPHGHCIDKEGVGVIRNPSSLQRNVRVGTHIAPHYDHVPTLLETLLEEINEKLREEGQIEDVPYCELQGVSFQRFESIHPFIDGNGRTGRLLSNYIATYCGRPINVFESELSERNQYYRAHKSPQDMCCFMAGKIQEAVFDETGCLLIRQGAPLSSSSIYRTESGENERQIHWHKLNFALESWKKSS